MPNCYNMKKIFLALAGIVSLAACSSAPKYANRAEMIAAQIHDPNSKYVVVACHRGDWRNYPENSIPAIESIIRMGADIMELDLKLTKNSVLVLSHDKTIDRCTNGTGEVSGYTLEELKAFAKTPSLKPGETATVALKFNTADLASFVETENAWIVEAGTYTLKVGANSRDIKAELSTEVAAKTTPVSKAFMHR